MFIRLKGKRLIKRAKLTKMTLNETFSGHKGQFVDDFGQKNQFEGSALDFKGCDAGQR